MHIATVGVVTVTMDDLSIPIDIHFNKLLGKIKFLEAYSVCFAMHNITLLVS